MANTIYKRIGLVQRKKTLTREQFEARWLGTHANLCTKLPGMRRYSINLIEAGRFPHFPYDGFSELWCDSEADLKAALERAEVGRRWTRRARVATPRSAARTSGNMRRSPTPASRATTRTGATTTACSRPNCHSSASGAM